MKRLFWIAFVGLLMVGPPALAHGEKGPHKGQMLLVGTHRFEMVVGDSSFVIYVMDMKKRVLPLKGVTGSVEIHSDNDKTANKVPLAVEGDHLVGKFDLKKLKTAEVHAKIMVDGKDATVAFEYPSN
jgi:uncharacterized Zn-binding protein involved in type VI secretion